jgi:uncharacterized protein with von Willebrand factor type A (vWA) domain/tetratricopeptide (TPR) repeat protein
MTGIRRFAGLSAVMCVTAIYTCAQIWGDAERQKPRERTPDLTISSSDADLGRDLAGSKFASGDLLNYRTKEGNLLFAMQIKPKLEAVAARPMDLLVMVDTSASQFGYPLTTAKRLAAELSAAAGTEDRVSIWTVNIPNATRNLTHGFAAAPSTVVETALKNLREEIPLGDTDLNNGLTQAVGAFPVEPGRRRAIVFLGDGMSTHNPLNGTDRARLSEAMTKNEISFFAVPLGPQLDPQNLHGLASGTGGAVIRIQPKEQAGGLVKRLHQSIATPILYPTNIEFAGGTVIEAFPTRLPPLRPDLPTLVIGRFQDAKELQYKIEGQVAGRAVTIENAQPITQPELDNFFLVGMFDQWKNAKDQPALMQADRALAFAHEMNQLARVELLAQAETALANDKLDAAEKLFKQVEKLDPNDTESQGGMKLVERIRSGKLSKDSIRKQFASRENVSNGKSAVGKAPAAQERIKNLLAQAEPPPAAQPPAASPGEAADLLRQQRQRQAIEEQRITQSVDDALREARRLLRTDPEGSRELLKRTLAAIRDNPELSDNVRQLLLTRMENTLRNVEIEGARIVREQAERQRLQAIAQERTQIDAARTAVEEQTVARMRVFHALMDQARFEEAYKQANAIIQDAVDKGLPVPVAVTAAYDTSLAATSLREIDEMRRVREARFLLTMLLVDKASVPYPDEPPISFPPAATWRELTRLRKEKYETIGLTEADPTVARKLRDLQNVLSRPVNIDFESGPLKEALGWISDRYSVPIVVDTQAFKDDLQINDVESQSVKLTKVVGVSLSTVLRLLLAQVQGTYIIRPDYIEVTTATRQAAEKVLRVYPVADLVIPIPNSINQQSVNQTIQNSILGYQLQLAQASFGGALGQLGFAGGLIGQLGALGALGALGQLGIGGAALGGGAFGGFAGLGGLAGNIGGIAGLTGGPGFQNLGVGGSGLAGFAGFGGQLGQFGNLGGQFGLQGGDQSRILIRIITQVVGTPADWAPPGLLQNLQGANQALGPGGVAEADAGANSGPTEGGQLGYYPPAQALLVKATSLVHTRASAPTAPRAGAAPPGGGGAGARLDVPRDDGIARANPPHQYWPKQSAPAGAPPDPNQGAIARANTPSKQTQRPGAPTDTGQGATARNDNKPDLEPRQIWQKALAEGVNDPGIIIACADFLFERGYFTHAAEFLRANLRQGIVSKPWVYEALTVALQASKGSPDDVERAQLSLVDLQPNDAMGYLKASHAMADAGRHDRALVLCRQASLLEPNAAQPYAEALVYAELGKDAEAMQWAASNLLRQDWPVDNRDLHLKAEERLKALARVLAQEKRDSEAERMADAAGRSRVRDLIIHLSWQGEADLDLEVKEPIGSTCSFLHRQSPGGGTLIGDTLDDRNNETYTASEAFSGEYRITLRRIWGQPLGSKATVEIIRNQGTAQESRHRETVSFDRTYQMSVRLEEGRRRSVAEIPPAATMKRTKVDDMSSSDRVLNKLRALAYPDDNNFATGVRGATASAGLPNENFNYLSTSLGGETVAYRRKMAPVATNAAEVTAQASVSADRRYVRLSLAPVFETVGGTTSSALVVNPVIPGGTGR